MRVSITHLRILVMVLNVALAFGLAGYYAHAVGLPPFVKSAEEPLAEIIPPQEFRDVKGGVGPKTDPVNQVTSASVWLQPSPPKTAEPVVVEEPEEEEPPEEGDPAEEGPLAEKGWEYVWCIVDHEAPENTLVMLRKSDEQSFSRPSVGRRFGGRSRRGRITRSAVRGRRRAINPNDLIAFRLGDRRVRDEDLDLDFYPVAADREKFIYATWVGRGVPLKRYRLDRQASTQYDESGRETLGPVEEEEESGDAGAGEEEEEIHIKVRPAGYKDWTSEEFQYFLRHGTERTGEVAEGNTPRRVGEMGSVRRPTRRVNRASASAASRRKTPTRRTTPTRSGPIKDPKERQKALQELNNALNDPKVPDKARKQVREALTKPRNSGK